MTLIDERVPADDSESTAITPQARTALWASLVGTTIEWYDFFLYATAASLVFNQAFFPDQTTFVGTMLSFATFAVGFVVRPIGGFVFGHIGDRIGRKKTLALTMVLMGGATALMGVLPTAAQIGVLAPVLLLLLRVVQGFALGGEWAARCCWPSSTGRRGGAGCSAASRRWAWRWDSRWAPGCSRCCRWYCPTTRSWPMAGGSPSCSASCW